jgi:hypothetical protein
LVSVVKIKDLDEAIELVRQQEVGNGACIFTQNKIATVRYAPPTGRFTDEEGNKLKAAPESKDVRSCVAS